MIPALIPNLIKIVLRGGNAAMHNLQREALLPLIPTVQGDQGGIPNLVPSVPFQNAPTAIPLPALGVRKELLGKAVLLHALPTVDAILLEEADPQQEVTKAAMLSQ